VHVVAYSIAATGTQRMPSTLHLDTGSSVRYRLVRAMQLGEGTITIPHLSARGWMSSHNHVDRVSPDGILICNRW